MSLEQNVLIVVITNGIINVYFFQFIIDPNIDSFAYKSRCCIGRRMLNDGWASLQPIPKSELRSF